MHADLSWTYMVMTTGNEGYIILTAKYLAENIAACACAFNLVIVRSVLQNNRYDNTSVK